MRTRFNRYFLVILFASYSVSLSLTAQGYQAIHGSPFAGSTGIFNNPAASVQSAYQWEFTLFSTQLKMSSNSPYIKNFSLKNRDSAELSLKEGYASRFLHTNADLGLFNGLYKIDNRRAVSFGIRVRSYNHIKTMPLNYVDSISSFNSFLITNLNTPYVQGFITHTGWLEADLNYSQVLMETNTSKLSGGVTLQIMKGISGAFMKLNKLSYLSSKNTTDTSFTFTNGSGSLGYSDNYDTDPGANAVKDFLKNTITRFGLSLGVEYLTYQNETGDNNPVNYDWKIGVSLMDIGSNTFKPSANSLNFYNPAPTIADNSVDNKLSGATSMKDFKDSLRTIFTNSSDITDNYSISNPTRLIINIDKHLTNRFYLNGELSMNFFSASNYARLRTRELNLLTVTPRWETIGWGAYLPVQYNTQGQLWVGAAIKIGPLIMGFHNLGLLWKNPTLNGGGYLLLSIHPFSKRNVLSKMECPR